MKGLDPIRANHLEDARGQAAVILADAHATGRKIMAAAAAEAEALLERAGREGDASADVDTGRDWTSARRRAREIVLGAQRTAFEDLRATVTGAVMSDARLPELVERAGRDAQRQLGPGAEVSVDRGTVTASRKGRHARWSVEDAVDESLARRGPEIEALWR